MIQRLYIYIDVHGTSQDFIHSPSKIVTVTQKAGCKIIQFSMMDECMNNDISKATCTCFEVEFNHDTW